ncbi:MAG TPA: DNA polymerase IV [Candidatus Ruthenibacterium merdigallinarum]|nr:DNA polymerase IV [Candidatus Ruthenibacterium merdigallinarum]
MAKDRVIFHCDCNSFYASVELLHHPQLRNVPMAVCGDPEQRRGVILAKNEAAKRLGVRTAQSVYEALRICPKLALVPPHHREYRRFSRQINAIYAQYTDRVEPFGIDESWLDMTGTWHLFGPSPAAVADLLRARVKAETGLTISVGVSFNKVFAKLGSDYRKPDATTVILQQDVARIVWPLPADALLYVGRAAKEALRRMGVETIGQLAAADPAALTAALGKLGGQLSQYARGEDVSEVRRAGDEREVKSVGNGLTFRRDLVGEADVRAGLAALADEVASRLRRYGLVCRAVQVTIKDPSLKSIQRQKHLDAPTCLARTIGAAALALVRANWDLRRPIRMLTVTALEVSGEDEPEQLSMFEAAAPQKSDEKRERLERSLDAIRRKYGKNSIAAADVLKNDIGLEGIEMEQSAPGEEGETE